MNWRRSLVMKGILDEESRVIINSHSLPSSWVGDLAIWFREHGVDIGVEIDAIHELLDAGWGSYGMTSEHAGRVADWFDSHVPIPDQE